MIFSSLGRLLRNFNVRIIGTAMLLLISTTMALNYYFYVKATAELRQELIHHNQSLAGILAHNSQLGVFTENHAALQVNATLMTADPDCQAIFFMDDGAKLIMHYAKHQESSSQASPVTAQIVTDKIVEYSASPTFFFAVEESIVMVEPVVTDVRVVEDDLLDSEEQDSRPDQATTRPKTIGYVALVMDLSRHAALTRARFVNNSTITIMATLFSCLIIFFLIRHFTTPLKRLAYEIHRNHPPATAPGVGGDDPFAGDFSHMIALIRQTYQTINDLNLSLEEKVLARTRELAASNQELTIQRAEREQYFTFFQNSSDLMGISDTAGAFNKTNPAFSGLLGYAESEIVARQIAELTHYDDQQVVPDDTARHLGWEVVTFESRCLCKNGVWHWLSWRVNFNRAEGLAYATGRDVTERKQAEERLQESERRFRAYIENSIDIIFTMNVDGAFVFVSPAWERHLGYPGSEILGKGFQAIVHPDDVAALIDYRHRVLTTRQSETSPPCRVQRADGVWRWFVTNGTTFLDKNDELLFLGVGRDITDHKANEEEIARSLKEKEVLLKEIHHRVKNNMQVVYSLLNLQSKGIADPATRTLFEESRNRVSSMALIHEKLYQSKDLAHINFKDYLQSVVVGIASTYGRSNISTVVDMERVDLDVNVGVPCGLIINELVSNSFKYAFPDGRKGTITIGIEKNSEGMHVLKVEDDGVGFPDGLDFRKSRSLGLQLVAALSRQIHGQIDFARNGGSKVAITFPSSDKKGCCGRPA